MEARDSKSSIRATRPPSSRARAIGLSAAALLFSSCASSRGTSDPWVYALSRDYYTASTGASLSSSFTYSSSRGCGEGAAIVYVCLYALPFVLDTAFLPVTIPHDLLLVD